MLAHELSHVRRGDYGTLLLASVYRAIFWFNPMSWWLDRCLRELAEQASDDSALRGAEDRTQYADVLLGFFESLQGRRGRIRWEGVAMARGSRAGRRIDRILAADRTLSAPVRWTVMAGIALLCAPLLYVTGALRPVVVMAQEKPRPAPARENTAEGPGYSASSKHHSSYKPEESYIMVSGDNVTMSGSSSDLRRATTMRKQLGDNFIWFRRDGKGYVIRDSAILSDAHKLFEPQQELGRRQSELGERQSKLGEQQSELGERQSSVRTTPQDLTHEIEKLKEKVKTASTRKSWATCRRCWRSYKPRWRISRRVLATGKRRSATSKPSWVRSRRGWARNRPSWAKSRRGGGKRRRGG